MIHIPFFFAWSSNTNTLKILSLLKNKQYSSALVLLEKGISENQNKSKKGHYALLLNQFPSNITMKKARHEYAFMAARWAEGISDKKRVSLWIEAGDGFFKTSHLEKADHCYIKALSYIKKEQSEFAYISHKRAWVYINQKKWKKAFNILNRAMEGELGHLGNIILSDMGKIWVESQYSKIHVPFQILEQTIMSFSKKERKTIIGGIVQGIRRMKKQNINKLADTLSTNQQLSTDVLNHIFDKHSNLFQTCRLLYWMEKTQTQSLNRTKALSVLNSCARSRMSAKKKNKLKKEKLEKIAHLYLHFDRTGIERWPLTLIYEAMGKKNKACNESLYQLTEVVELMDKDIAKVSLPATKNTVSKPVNTDHHNKKIDTTIKEVFRLCKKKNVKSDSQLIMKTANTLLSSPAIVNKYKNIYESTLFNLMDMKLFYPVAQKSILTANKEWKGKDLLPALLLSRINNYSPEEIRYFLNHFGSKPVEGYYLDILIVRTDILTPESLQQWLPVSRVESYKKLLPWLKNSLSGNINPLQKKEVLEKLLKYFPSKKKERKEAGLFLALNYLKTNQISEIFKHWNKISSVFRKKDLAVSLFEKSLYEVSSICNDLSLSSPVYKHISSDSFLRFIFQCCQIVNSEGETWESDLKVPSVLRSNALARDFVLLTHAQKKTVWLEKNMFQLKNKTSQMITDLQKGIAKYQKRKWRLKTVAQKMNLLLNKQINLFENQLTELSGSSTHGEQYEELKKIVVQWR